MSHAPRTAAARHRHDTIDGATVKSECDGCGKNCTKIFCKGSVDVKPAGF